MGLIGIILIAIATANSVVCIIEWCGGLIKEIINKDKKTNEAEDRVEELSRTFEIERSLNGILNNQRAEINRLKQQISNNSEQDEHMKNNDKQIVYKIEEGDLNGDIKGDNIIVILMNGDINGDINSKEGDVVLIKGDINGDVIANKVIRQQPKSEYENYIDKLSSVEKLSKPDKEYEAHCLCAKPNTNCAKCAWYDYVEQECKSWDANEGECQFIDKYEPRDKIKNSLRQLPPNYVRCVDCKFMEDTNVTANGLSTHKYCNCSNEGGLSLLDKYAKRVCVCFKKKEPPSDYVKCADCVYAENYNLEMYKCTKYNGVVLKDSVCICDSFKQQKRHICNSCYHFVKGINESYCSKHNLDKLYNSITYCSEYDGTGETTNYKCDCARFSNNSGICFSFHVLGCPIKNNCPDKIERKD